MAQSLAVKYRPNDWDSLVEQDYIKIILENQIKTNDIKHSYLFTGPAGCGKTTTARIFANKINEGKGLPIEVDAASNNSVDNIRTIIDDAKFKPLDSKYKIYILDEVHMLSIGAWNALLKLLEEPPETTIFIMCTTDAQKIPKTILSRCQRFDFTKISLNHIVQRLKFIINSENKEYIAYREREENMVPFGYDIDEIEYEEEALKFIAKVAEGGMRDAISNLDKVLSYTHKLTIENVVNALGISDYTNLDKLLTAILKFDDKEFILIIENIYNKGKDLKLFIKQFISFILDTCKYYIYQNYDNIQIPSTIDLKKYMLYDYMKLLSILNLILKISNEIKYEQNPKVIIESEILIYILEERKSKENGYTEV